MALLAAVSVRRKPRFLLTVAGFFVAIFYLSYDRGMAYRQAGGLDGGGGVLRPKLPLPPAAASDAPIVYINSSFDWAARPRKYPIAPADLVRLPPPSSAAAAAEGLRPPRYRVQHDFAHDDAYRASHRHNKMLRDTRRDAVREAFRRAWESYRQHAWGYDELLPVRLQGVDGYSGWGATLVDGLDALWVLGLRDEFDEAVRAVATIDWDAAAAFECSLFETTIRYLGGLLSAYEMSRAEPLLQKATELAHMLLAGFDTANHMPANGFHFARARQGLLVPSDREAAAAAGTLSLEFTRLAQLTGDDRFYDAIARVTRALAGMQDATTLPGLWPTYLNLQTSPPQIADAVLAHNRHEYTLGGLADSLYEYLPKMHMLLGGGGGSLGEGDGNGNESPDAAQYRTMYTKAADAARQYLLYRPMVPDPDAAGHDVLAAGNALADGHTAPELVPETQHLSCFAGGMFALGGRLFNRSADVDVGRQLAQGCVWAYASFPTGVMPELADLVPCPPRAKGATAKMLQSLGGSAASAAPAVPDACPWDEAAWRAAQRPADARWPPGFANVRDARYLLRPEAVESVFVLYRVTGDAAWQQAAWDMFLSIERSTATKHANSAIADVTVTGPPQKLDAMESFWFAETLKYLYLTFADPDYFSLDDWVFNTEAHPFQLPTSAATDGAGNATAATR
ncbi:Glycoside hydrolase, family 47 [Niveomyces insectorum RCEF 264]|uniref:alpha-1,2-Mannosidase n=1 Tax=Niveomyces insectorum RCEF 264 TaxID=1081102 RepID=A0A167VJ13_9HYPO|nr:Glycoside hydrolase, family 47 [Niveomyces insectorum RCEF 264]